MGDPEHATAGWIHERACDARLAVFTEMDPWSASTRYRALQYLPHLERAFAQVTLSLARDTRARRPGRIGQVRYFAGHAGHYLRRGAEVARLLRGADTVLVQRGLYPLGPGVIARPLLRFSGRVVLDLDDDVFSRSPDIAGRGPLTRWLYGPQQTAAVLRRADAIVVSTRALAELIPPCGATPIVIPTVPDPDAFAPVAHSDTRPIRVGWTGTVGGIAYLDPLREVFAALAYEGLVELEIVSSRPWSGPATFRSWTLAEETSLFSRFDVGVMPLPDTAYTRAKAGFKLLQYMAAGLPVVASPIGVNVELVERSGGGLLAESPEEWRTALTELACDAQLRSRLGALGRAFVREYADIEGKAAQISGLLAHG